MITWETVLENAYGGVWRARVDGGWLVSQRYGGEPEVVDFVPDDYTTGPGE